jgi:hypothetical protein
MHCIVLVKRQKPFNETVQFDKINCMSVFLSGKEILKLSTCLGMVEESDDTVLVLVRANPAAAVVPVLHHVREGARGLQLRARALDIHRADDATATDSAATSGGRRKHPGRWFSRKALGFG